MKAFLILALFGAPRTLTLGQNLYQQVQLGKGVGYPICTGSKSHFKQDPDDCHSFYQCDKDSNFDTFHVYKFECEEGLAYDIQSEACVLETFVNRCWHTCPEGWELFQGSCYLLTRQRVDTFQKAKQFCQNLDGYLVEIESKDEDDFLIEQALALSGSPTDQLDYWMGAEDPDHDGVWTWTTSGKPLVYTNWWRDMGRLNATCIQLLRDGWTSPNALDSFYWAHASTGYECMDSDDDNGVICEKSPDISLP